MGLDINIFAERRLASGEWISADRYVYGDDGELERIPIFRGRDTELLTALRNVNFFRPPQGPEGLQISMITSVEWEGFQDKPEVFWVDLDVFADVIMDFYECPEDEEVDDYESGSYVFDKIVKSFYEPLEELRQAYRFRNLHNHTQVCRSSWRIVYWFS